MPDIDLTTLTALSLFINLMVAGYMLLLATLHKSQPAFRHWAVACVIFVFAVVLAVSRIYNVAPLLSVWLAHSLLALPPLLIATGLLRFFRGNAAALPFKTLLILYSVYVIALFASYNYSHSAALLTAIAVACASLWCIRVLNLNTLQPALSRTLQWVLLLHVFSMLAEILLYLQQWPLPLAPLANDYLQLILCSHLLLTTIAAALLPLLHFVHREQHLMLQADRDELTQLPNRRHFLRESSAYLSKNNGRAPVVVMMLDLDHFKAINDNFGHAVGDAALKQVAAILGAELRNTDFIGRMGGEEFAIVMPNTTKADARRIGDRLRLQVEQQADTVEGYKIDLTVSIGAIFCHQTTGVDFQSLLKRADDALFQAKRAGRNGIIFNSAA